MVMVSKITENRHPVGQGLGWATVECWLVNYQLPHKNIISNGWPKKPQ